MSCLLRKSSVLFATVHLGFIPSSQTSGGTPKPTQLQDFRCTLQNSNKDQLPPIALADFGRTSFTIFTTMFHHVSIYRKTYLLAMLYPFISLYLYLYLYLYHYIIIEWANALVPPTPFSGRSGGERSKRPTCAPIVQIL